MWRVSEYKYDKESESSDEDSPPESLGEFDMTVSSNHDENSPPQSPVGVFSMDTTSNQGNFCCLCTATVWHTLNSK